MPKAAERSRKTMILPISDIISSSRTKWGQNIDIFCRRINGNISSIETYLVELMRRINLSI